MAPAPWQSFGTGFPETTLERRVAEHARAMPDRVAAICGEETLAWAELDRRADALAGWLIESGLRPGDRLGWLGRNRLEFPVVLVACRRARLVLAGLNWRLSAQEMARIVQVADCALIVSDAEFRHLLSEGAPVFDTHALIAQLPSGTVPAVTPATQDDDLTTLFFTSGTTGLPKGLAYTLESVERVVGAPHTLDFSSESVLLIVAPVFHTAGWMWVQYGLFGGMTQVLLPAAAADTMLESAARHRVTHAQWVPALLAMALDAQDRTPVDLSALKIIAYGASPIQPHLLARAMRGFNCDFTQVYGLTETVGPVSHLPPAAHRADAGIKSQATGIVNPGVELRIVAGDGRPCPQGERGEILVRMPFPPPRCFGPTDAKGITSDGWVSTGDAGFLDEEGYLWVCDRIGDMIITGGENVYPAEVDNILAAQPGVREAAIFAIKDPRWGEKVCGAVAMREGSSFEPDRLIGACREELAHYKCPQLLVAVDRLPRNAAGKVLRRELSERYGT